MPDMLRNAMSVDVEDYFQVAALDSSVKRGDWEDLESRVERNTDRLLQIFSDAEVSATFFVLGWVADRHPHIVRRICEEGHELASHGYSHKLIYKQSREEFAEETRRSKSTLEDISGRQVFGYRAASYSITPKSLWAVDVLVDAGFEYDSSIVPVRHDLYGVPGAKAHPYRLELRDGRSIVEFPPSTISLLGHRLPIGGGGYFRLFPYWFTRWGLRTINERERMPFTFYLHPWELDPDQPRFEHTSLKSRFRHYTNLDRCEARLLRLLSQFRFTTKQSVLSTVELPAVALDAVMVPSTET